MSMTIMTTTTRYLSIHIFHSLALILSIQVVVVFVGLLVGRPVDRLTSFNSRVWTVEISFDRQVVCKAIDRWALLLLRRRLQLHATLHLFSQFQLAMKCIVANGMRVEIGRQAQGRQDTTHYMLSEAEATNEQKPHSLNSSPTNQIYLLYPFRVPSGHHSRADEWTHVPRWKSP